MIDFQDAQRNGNHLKNYISHNAFCLVNAL